MSVQVVFALLLVAGLALQLVGRMYLASLGRKAMNKQPDRIHLVTDLVTGADEDGLCVQFANPLLREGFVDAGTFSIPELPGVKVRFLVHQGERAYAALYQHPKVKEWCEVISRYEDGTGATFTQLAGSGLDPEPANLVVRRPGTGPVDLFQQALRERPAGALIAVNRSNVGQLFCDAWARSIAWRKSRGISAREVAQVARKRAA